ncbi:twin transmembrane helix small protein [Palleronia sediminis]|uniref:Twin transmembrane helix small protein n=1 Tax=Palleronia sediminis TaxID=2547833 RepID=A0A4R6A2U2_9RHOB|nr:twin transmembrane helix small protein [Palleronia sediminis]TDL76278.1 twin transmembrane helix small protein [Palleronia sediminis]
MLADPLFLIVAASLLVVLVILAIGVGNFGRGGEAAAKNSNKYMRWRIYAQAVAIVVILAFVFFRQ